MNVFHNICYPPPPPPPWDAIGWFGYCFFVFLPEIKHKREDIKEDLNESDLEKIVDLTLTETETIWLLDMPAICVSMESDEAAIVTKKNDAYSEVSLSFEVRTT